MIDNIEKKYNDESLNAHVSVNGEQPNGKAKKRIAQIGTFDCENMGDLLFPSVLRKMLDKNDMENAEVCLFSPIGGDMPFSPDIKVLPVSRLLESHREKRFDAILIGGGDMIRLDQLFASEQKYLTNCNPVMLWTLPVLVGLTEHIPVYFNAPGVPFSFLRSQYGWLKSLLSCVDYISVRDVNSRAFLRDAVGMLDISVVPDTVYAMAEFYPKDELPFKDIAAKYPSIKSGQYVLLQLNSLEYGIKPDEYLSVIQQYRDQCKCDVFLMPIGYVHSDPEVLQTIYSYVEDKIEHVEYCYQKLTPLQMLALIANAKAFIGTSYHGSIISYIYGIPMLIINPYNLTKINGLVDMLGIPERMCTSILDVPESLQYLDAIDNTQLPSLIKRVNKHFSFILHSILNGSKNITQFSSIYESIPVGIWSDFSSCLYYSCDNDEFSQSRVIHLKLRRQTNGLITFSRVHLPLGIKRIRFDPCDGFSFAAVRNINVHTDTDTLFVQPINGKHVDDIDLFISDDPQYIFISETDIHWIDISAEIVPIPIPKNDSVFDVALLEDVIMSVFRLNQSMQTQMKEFQQVNGQHEETIHSLQQVIEEQTSYVKTLQHVNTEQKSAIDILHPLNKQQRETIDALQQVNAEYQSSISVLHNENDALNEDLKNARAEMKALEEQYENRIGVTNVQLQDAMNENASLNAQLLETRDRNEVLNSHLQAACNDCETVKVRLLATENENSKLYDELQVANSRIAEINLALHNATIAYSTISNAFFWRITKPFRFVSDKAQAFIQRYRYSALLMKGMRCLKQNGLRYTIEKMRLRKNAKTIHSNTDVIRHEDNRDSDELIKFSVIVPLYNTPIKELREMIESVLNQTYRNWQLCLCDGSDDEHDYIREYCEEVSARDTRVLYKKLDQNLGISKNSNACAAMADGDYLVLLDHDDILSVNALHESAIAIDATHADVLYSDEDHLSISGKHEKPFFKPDWSPDLLYSQMYIAHLLVVKRELFERVGGFRSDFDGSQDYDLMLRLSEVTQNINHIPKILYSWRESENSTASDADAKPYARDAGLHALEKHLKRKYGENAKAELIEGACFYTPRFGFPFNSPKVSIIIPMKDNWECSDNCVTSIIERSTYNNYEVLLLNNRSEEEETFKWFKQIVRDKRVRIVEADMEFNWSKINNFGAKEASGDVLIFLNNDTVVISPDWIERLCENALRVDVGVVGPLLLYEDGTIQHAGVVVGLGGWADHVFKGMRPIHYCSPYVSPMVGRNVLAVTGACLAISRRVMDIIGGFDEEFIICGSDVELCIRAYEAGYINRYDPNVKLYHLESASRDDKIPEVDFKKSYECYSHYREYGDPYYNTNLDLEQVKPTMRCEIDMNYRKYINFIKRQKLLSPLYEKAKQTVLEIQAEGENYDIVEIFPIKARIEEYNSQKRRWNLLIPTVNRDYVFGGIATAIKLFDELIAQSDDDFRILVTDSSIENDGTILSDEWVQIPITSDSLERKQVVSISDRYAKTIPVRAGDIFIATGWWTAYTIADVIRWQIRTFESASCKLVYLIQDYEPGFYAWSSRYLLADSTYRLDIPTIAIFNSKYLQDFFIEKGYNFEYEHCFEPTLNSALKKVLMETENPPQMKKMILIYGRPSVKRNAFELIIGALQIWCQTQKDASDWTVYSVGEAHRDIDIGNGCVVRSLGKLPLKKYADIMLEAYLGIDLMVSPHPSYPPLEMATFGMRVITNSYANKDLSSFDNYIISLDNCSQLNLARTICSVCAQFGSSLSHCMNNDYINDNHNLSDTIKSVLEHF